MKLCKPVGKYEVDKKLKKVKKITNLLPMDPGKSASEYIIK